MGLLCISNITRYDNIIWNDKQQVKLDEELSSFALLVDIDTVNWIK